MRNRKKKYRLYRRCRANGVQVHPGFRWRTDRIGLPCVVTLQRYQKFVGIDETGRFDSPTMDVLFPERFRKRIANIAAHELGTHEWPAGSNWGPVSRFIEPFIGKVPTAWCAFFGIWSAVQAGFPRERVWKDVGWVDSWLREARSDTNPYVILIDRIRAGRGDFALMDWNGDGDPDHLAIITAKVGPVAVFSTVEGNVGAYGGSVERRTRLVTQAHAFIRLRHWTRR